jgi:hypothetical protein
MAHTFYHGRFGVFVRKCAHNFDFRLSRTTKSTAGNVTPSLEPFIHHHLSMKFHTVSPPLALLVVVVAALFVLVGAHRPKQDRISTETTHDDLVEPLSLDISAAPNDTTILVPGNRTAAEEEEVAGMEKGAEGAEEGVEWAAWTHRIVTLVISNVYPEPLSISVSFLSMGDTVLYNADADEAFSTVSSVSKVRTTMS